MAEASLEEVQRLVPGATAAELPYFRSIPRELLEPLAALNMLQLPPKVNPSLIIEDEAERMVSAKRCCG